MALTYANFKDKGGYFTFTGNFVQICIEPCFNGADVAVYNKDNLDLIVPKVCLNLQGWGPGERPTIEMVRDFKDKAMVVANEFYTKYELN